MRGPRIAINATMLTAALRIDAGLEPDVRAVVLGDDGAGVVPQELRVRRGILLRVPIHVAFQLDFLKPVGGIPRRPAARNWLRITVHPVENTPSHVKVNSPLNWLNRSSSAA